ncbi:hypothetical protein M758_10G169000 [Ceratodon purpureus]|nr:hypothetical protein M758_10G169000 [Ceratodon purpureus]
MARGLFHKRKLRALCLHQNLVILMCSVRAVSNTDTVNIMAPIDACSSPSTTETSLSCPL